MTRPADAGAPGMGVYEKIALGSFVVVAVVSSLRPIYPDQLLLQHVPTALTLVALMLLGRWYPLSRVSFTLVLAFLTLHVIGARWIYSNVPYDEWTSALFGFQLTEVFGWERNHYDRLVHFCFGFLLAYPVEELVRRVIRPRRGWSYYVTIEFVLASSVLYELVEWGIALTFAPEWADRYLGQQGDIWDAHKDMALATLGALLAMAAAAGVRRFRAPG